MYYAMQDRKNISPPVNMLVAGYLGYKPEKRSKAGEEEEGDLQDLINMFGGGGLL